MKEAQVLWVASEKVPEILEASEQEKARVKQSAEAKAQEMAQELLRRLAKRRAQEMDLHQVMGLGREMVSDPESARALE